MFGIRCNYRNRRCSSYGIVSSFVHNEISNFQLKFQRIFIFIFFTNVNYSKVWVRQLWLYNNLVIFWIFVCELTEYIFEREWLQRIHKTYARKYPAYAIAVKRIVIGRNNRKRLEQFFIIITIVQLEHFDKFLFFGWTYIYFFCTVHTCKRERERNNEKTRKSARFFVVTRTVVRFGGRYCVFRIREWLGCRRRRHRRRFGVPGTAGLGRAIAVLGTAHNSLYDLFYFFRAKMSSSFLFVRFLRT